jgi:hypothetical protein
MIIEINDNLSLNPFHVISASFLGGYWVVKTTVGDTFSLTPEEYMKLDDYGFDVKQLIDRLSDSTCK